MLKWMIRSRLIGYAQDGEAMMRGHRRIYYSWSMHRSITAPIGLHILFRIVLRVHQWSYFYSETKLETYTRRIVKEAYREGYAVGQADEYNRTRRQRETERN